jgi:hypothetical protein
MRSDEVANLAFLEKGQAFIAEISKVVKKVQIILPRTMYWKKEYPNFYKGLWEKHGGDWMNISDTKDYINNLYDKNIKEIKEQEKMKQKEPKKKFSENKVIIKDNEPQIQNNLPTKKKLIPPPTK